MNNKVKIDNFLKFFRDILIQNPQIELNKEMVYHQLVSLGIPETEKNKTIKHNFNEWINHFSTIDNCDVFVAENWQYFCQFVSHDNVAKTSTEHIKIYIPLDANHIEYGANQIFEFLARENIPHVSKIGSHVRFDDIVIRLVNPNDSVKLINFVTNNSYIQEGLLQPNPFAFNINGIAMASDGRLSYNSTVAHLISLYIDEKKRTNSLNTINIDNFYNYINNYYNYAFSSNEGFEKLKQDFRIQGDIPTQQIVNYKNVFELIIKTNQENFTFQDYISHYEECRNSHIHQQKCSQVETIKSSSAHDSKNEINELLLFIINTMIEKYQDLDIVLNNINQYINTGNENYITRYKGLRENITNSKFRENIITILESNNINFINYSQDLLQQKKQEKDTNSDKKSTVEKSVILTIIEILEIMTNKYGKNFALENLEGFIKSGEPTLLTKENNLRERVVNSSFRKDVFDILTERNIDLNNFLLAASSQIVHPNEVYLEQAILETYKKYEMKFEEGISNLSGKYVTTQALFGLINQGLYTGFTRDNDVRYNLQKNVSREDAITIIKKELGITEINYTQISQIVEQYVQKIIDNNMKNTHQF